MLGLSRIDERAQILHLVEQNSSCICWFVWSVCKRRLLGLVAWVRNKFSKIQQIEGMIFTKIFHILIFVSMVFRLSSFYSIVFRIVFFWYFRIFDRIDKIVIDYQRENLNINSFLWDALYFICMNQDNLEPKDHQEDEPTIEDLKKEL